MSKKTIILFACTLALLIAALAFAFWNSALVARLSDEIAAADNQNKQLTQQVTDLTAQLTATQTQRDTLSKQLTDEKTLASNTQTTLNQQLTDLSAQMSTEQTAAAAAQATLNQQVTDLSSQLADEKAAAADLQTALGTANQQIAQLEKDVLEQQSAANVAQAKCELLTTQLGKSEDELARARTEIASLQTQLITAHKDNSALKTENATLSTQLSDAQNTVASLNAANAQLTQEKQDLNLTLSARAVDIGTLQKKLETLQLQFDSLTADHTALQSENADLTDRIVSLESQLTAAQNAPSTAIQLEGMSGEELLDLIDKAHNQFIELTCRVVNSSGGGYSGNQSIDVALDDRYIIRDLKIGPEDFRTNPQLLAPVMSGAFVNQFIGMPCPINAEDIDFVAGATETCNTIIELINSSYEHLLNDTEVNNRQIDAAYVHSTLAIGTAESLIDNVSVIVGIDENGKTTFVTLNPSLSPVAAAFTDKCNDPEYLATFTGISYLTEPSDIHVMTGATFTSRAIAKAIDNAYENAGALGRSVDTIYSFCPEESLAVEGGEMRFAAHFDQNGTILHIDSYGADEKTQAFLDSLVGLDPSTLEMRGDGLYPNDEILEMIFEFLYESVL